MTRRHIAPGVGATVLLLVGLLAFVIPLRTSSGIIDTTRNQCPSLPATTKRYHLLLGQLHDYRLVKPHIVNAANSHDCGQSARLLLYL
jgi:hypothetical protein